MKQRSRNSRSVANCGLGALARSKVVVLPFLHGADGWTTFSCPCMTGLLAAWGFSFVSRIDRDYLLRGRQLRDNTTIFYALTITLTVPHQILLLVGWLVGWMLISQQVWWVRNPILKSPWFEGFPLRERGVDMVGVLDGRNCLWIAEMLWLVYTWLPLEESILHFIPPFPLPLLPPLTPFPTPSFLHHHTIPSFPPAFMKPTNLYNIHRFFPQVSI